MTDLPPRIFYFTWPSTQSRKITRQQKSQYIYTHIQQQITQVYAIPYSSIQITKSKHGKPNIQLVTSHPHPTLFLSISHCQYHSVYILHHSACALDLEPLLPRTHLTPLMQRLLNSIRQPLPQKPHYSAQLLSQWQQLPPSAQLQVFYKLWTFSESWCKWHDQTLWQTLQHGIPFPWPNITSLQNCHNAAIASDCICHFHTPNNSLLCIFTKTPLPTSWQQHYTHLAPTFPH